MHEYYEIHPAKSQLVVLLVSQGLAAVAIIFYLQPLLLKMILLAILLLLAIFESRCLIRQEIINLHLNRGDASIEFEQGGQPYFYRKNKVYETRWFAILKLDDEDKSRTLILNPDRFNSIQCYQRLRYSLRKMGHRNAA